MTGVESASANERIWQVVAMIPAGRVATYGQVATLAGLPGRARLVGRVMSQLPAGSRIPWHRVVNAAGRLSLPPGSRGYREQRARLSAEGVVVRAGKLSLGRFRWHP